jgi:hypothetical protein
MAVRCYGIHRRAQRRAERGDDAWAEAELDSGDRGSRNVDERRFETLNGGNPPAAKSAPREQAAIAPSPRWIGSEARRVFEFERGS